MLLALQAGSRGTQACINAASTVSGIIGDLDTTIMFATAGSLNTDNDDMFADHRLKVNFRLNRNCDVNSVLIMTLILTSVVFAIFLALMFLLQ